MRVPEEKRLQQGSKETLETAQLLDGCRGQPGTDVIERHGSPSLGALRELLCNVSG